MRRVRSTCRTPTGATRSSRWPPRADVVVESFRPGVVDRLGIGFEALRARQPGDHLLLDHRVRPGRPAGGLGRSRPQLPRPSGGYLAMSEPAADGGPPVPGATIADAAAGGMQAALAVMAALVGAGRHRRGRLPRRVGRRRGALAHVARRRRAPGHRDRARRRDTTCSPAATPATTPTGPPTAGGSRSGRSSPSSSPTCAGPSGCEQWADHQLDDEVQDDDPRRLRGGLRRRDRDAWVAELAGADTCVAPVLPVTEVGDDEQYAVGVAAVVEAEHPDARVVPPGRAGARRHGPADRAGVACPTSRSPTPTSCSRRPGSPAERVAELREGSGRRVSSAVDRRRPGSLIGVEQYEEDGEFPVERGYIWTTCAVGRERQPALLGRRGGRRDHRRDRSRRRPWSRSGSGPTTGRRGGPQPAPPAAGPLRPEGGPRPARGGDDRQHHRLPRAGAARRPAAHPPGAALGERREDDQARHRPLLGDRRRVPQPAWRPGGGRELHRLRLPPRARRRPGRTTERSREPARPHAPARATSRSATCCPSCATR